MVLRHASGGSQESDLVDDPELLNFSLRINFFMSYSSPLKTINLEIWFVNIYGLFKEVPS